MCAPAILLVLLALSCARPEPKASQPVPEEASSGGEQKPVQLNSWRLSTDNDRMDNTPTVYLSKFAESGQSGILTIRCIHSKTELVVATDDILDNGRVRIKFGDAKPQQQVWTESSNHTALFATDPIGLARLLTKADSFLFEYRPFQKQPTTIEFKVAGLAERLSAVSDACGWAKIDRAKAVADAAAKADAELARKRDRMIREALSKHVEPCHEEWLREKGRWCWYDPADSYFKNGGSPAESREAALKDAIETAKFGRVFKKEIEQIDGELK